MATQPDKRRGPGQGTQASPKSIATDIPSMTHGHRQAALTTLDELAHIVDGTFVVVVEHPGAKYRRRCFLTAASAERSARAAQARGVNAVVYMAELKPLWRIVGGDLA